MNFRPFAVVMLLALLGVSTDGAGLAPYVYRFSEVKSKVILDHAQESKRVADGAIGVAGDIVRTGWRGRAVVAVTERGSRFEIRPGSRVQLASKRPGVLVLVERGSLKAFFDKLMGDDERLVETPGALLAVRGTRYGLEVAADGNAAVTVFEGRVEIRPFDRKMKPLLVSPGEVGAFGPRMAPAVLMKGMSESTWNRRGAMSELQREMAPRGMKGPDAGRPTGTKRGSMGRPH